MTARDHLHALIDQLDDDDAAEVLQYTRWLLAEGRLVTAEARLAALRALLDDVPRD